MNFALSLKMALDSIQNRICVSFADTQSLNIQQSALLALAFNQHAHSGDLRAFLREVTETSSRTLNAARVNVWFFDNDTRITCHDDYSSKAPCGHSMGARISSTDCPTYFEAIKANRVLVIDDAVNHPLTRDFAYVHEMGIGAMVDAPIRLDGKVIGIVCHEHLGAKRHWSVCEQTFAASVADMIALAVSANHRAKVETELQAKSGAIEAAMDGVAILNNKQIYTYLNKAHAQVYGYDSAEELLGKSWKVLYDQEQVAEFERLHMPLFKASGQIRIEAIGRKKDGTNFPQEITLTALPERGLICVVRDITQRKLAEAENVRLHSELLQSQKMEALGQLAGGVAHDFNNLLTGIFGYVQLLKMSRPQDKDVLHTASLIEDTAGKASQLTQKLLNFSRKSTVEKRVVDLHKTISASLDLFNRTIPRNIVVNTNLLAQSHQILADSVQLEQMLLNLVVNARDAITERSDIETGEITISTKDCTAPPELRNSINGEEPFIELSVSDTGCGINPNIVNKIFEPFFTTKPPDHGTGMGLAMVYTFIKEHGGTVKVESAPGEGTIFRLYFPRTKRPLASQVERLHNNPILSGTGKILVVEDNSVIRDVVGRMLGSLGYEADIVRDGLEALERIKSGASFSLVLLDMVTPNMGARECLNRIRSLIPNVPVVLCTGYSDSELLARISVSENIKVMKKPFHLSELSTTIADSILRLVCITSSVPIVEILS